VTEAGSGQPQVAVLGCGHWGRNLVRTFAERGALAAVVDPDAEAAAALAERHGTVARSLDEVLADPAVDAVVIAAPAARHGELALAVIGAGKHVYVEKPLALDVAEAEAVVEAAERAGVVLMVGHLLQYHPAFLALRSLVADGSLGQLRYLYSNRVNLGRFRREENILWSFAPHDLSMLLALVGDEPDHVSAVGATFLSSGIPDVTTTHLGFPGGQRAHVFVSWLHPFKEQRLVVVGSDAMAVFDDLQPWESKLTVYEHGVSWDGATPVPVPAEGNPIPLEVAEPLGLECDHFLDCVRDGSVPRTDGREGLRVLRVLDAAQRSLASPPPAAPLLAPPNGEPGVSPNAVVHESAYVDDGAVVGAGTRVWHFSHVLAGTTIGEDCTLGQNVVVGPDVTVGDRCRIQNNVSVYRGVTLEDGVFCGPSCVFTNVVNPRAEVSRKDEFRSTVVRRGATIGANATIVCGNEIGAYAFIGAGAVVTADVAPHALVVGSPARRIGWMSHDGERLDDDLVCPRSGRTYAVLDGELVEVGVAGRAVGG
jgi:UDP-2-acetamido-3-amino-2,3-dideoxy-glucuronate N-acetyltransferase